MSTVVTVQCRFNVNFTMPNRSSNAQKADAGNDISDAYFVADFVSRQISSGAHRLLIRTWQRSVTDAMPSTWRVVYKQTRPWCTEFTSGFPLFCSEKFSGLSSTPKTFFPGLSHTPATCEYRDKQKLLTIFQHLHLHLHHCVCLPCHSLAKNSRTFQDQIHFPGLSRAWKFY